MLQLNDQQNGRMKIKSMRKAALADRLPATAACDNSTADAGKPPC